MSDFFDMENPSSNDIDLKILSKEPKMDFITFKAFYNEKLECDKEMFCVNSFETVDHTIKHLLTEVDKGVTDNFLKSHLPKYITDYFKLFNGICINGSVTVLNCSDKGKCYADIDEEPVIPIMIKILESSTNGSLGPLQSRSNRKGHQPLPKIT